MGTKDVESASLVIEPLARYDENGNLTPWLVDEVPTVGERRSEPGPDPDHLENHRWTCLVPTARRSRPRMPSSRTTTARIPEGGCAQATKYEGVVSVETPDALTVVVTFDKPTPNPYGPFVGGEAPVIQAAQFADCLGAKAPECTEANFNPIGTGPFVVTEFKPNDVISFAANENYRVEGKPAFATVTFKGGGDATAAGRAVMETGEFDYAWNLQLAPDVIAKMQEGGMGTPVAGFGPLVERLMLNNTNPDPGLGPDERSVVRPHPFLQDPAVYKAHVDGHRPAAAG